MGVQAGAVEAVVMTEPGGAIWKGRRVLVTGHTGFKGGWLCLWLHRMGAQVHGYALSPPTEPSLFAEAHIEEVLASHTIGDVRDADGLARTVRSTGPEVVFHLAAQPLVRDSYRRPVETYEVNVMGLVHLLEAVRAIDGVKAVVNVTSDKCYENRDWEWGYREHEALGGHDPYSSSKGCAELVTAAYRRSFLAAAGVAVATARAGNVVGGGDWAPDRLVPDVLRARDAGRSVVLRSPEATRPWQHVLEPVSGYLMLAARLLTADGGKFSEAWNFGPADDDARTVGWIVERIAAHLPGLSWSADGSAQPHEATYLKIDSSKARARLSWRPQWTLDLALDATLDWHMAWRGGGDMQAFTLAQIEEYQRDGIETSCGAV